MERLDDMLAARARVAALVPRGAGRAGAERGLRAAVRGRREHDGDVRGWFVFVVQVPHGGPTATTSIRALRARGVQSKPYLPAIHLMSYYRETFGYREGKFPVCEDVAARSLALPFFPADDAAARSSASRPRWPTSWPDGARPRAWEHARRHGGRRARREREHGGAPPRAARTGAGRASSPRWRCRSCSGTA